MASTRWKRWIGLALIGAGVGYLRARARREQAEREEPIDLPVGGEMAVDAGIAPVDPEPMTQIPGEGAHAQPSRIP